VGVVIEKVLAGVAVGDFDSARPKASDIGM
jgi:hypothetical protein